MNPSGLYEHVHGVPTLAEAIAYWAVLGYEEVGRGALAADEAAALYGVHSAVASVRLAHRAGDAHGLVRLLQWEQPLGDGLGYAKPLVAGSRWTAFGTTDTIRVREAYEDEAAATGERWDLYAVTKIPSAVRGVAVPRLTTPFVGVRETVVIGRLVRHAFIGGIGMTINPSGYAEGTVLPVSRPIHGDLVVPSAEVFPFYRDAFGLETPTPPNPSGWHNRNTRLALDLEEGQGFIVQNYQSPGLSDARLRVYALDGPAEDLRDRSRPGHLGPCLFTYRYPAGTLEAVRQRVAAAGGEVGPIVRTEFGERAFGLTAPDGIAWQLLEAPAP
jgi:hypothetical protein